MPIKIDLPRIKCPYGCSDTSVLLVRERWVVLECRECLVIRLIELAGPERVGSSLNWGLLPCKPIES